MDSMDSLVELSELIDIPADKEVPRFIFFSSIDFLVGCCMLSVTSRLKDRGETRCICGFVFVDSVSLFVLSDRTGVGILSPEFVGLGGVSACEVATGAADTDLLTGAIRGIEDLMPVVAI